MMRMSFQQARKYSFVKREKIRNPIRRRFFQSLMGVFPQSFDSRIGGQQEFWISLEGRLQRLRNEESDSRGRWTCTRKRRRRSKWQGPDLLGCLLRNNGSPSEK